MDTTAMLAEAAQGRLAGLILLGADPISDFPDRSLAKKGLQGAGFTVAVDCYLTESSKKADVILPAATYAERSGTFTNIEGRVLRLGQKVTAPGVAWPDWMIAAELAFRLGGDLGFDNLEGIWDEVERLSPTHAGVTSSLLASMRAKDGVVVPIGLDEAEPPSPLDPMAEPGIIAAETNWVSFLDVPPPGTEPPGEVDRGPVGDVGSTDPLAGGVGGPIITAAEALSGAIIVAAPAGADLTPAAAEGAGAAPAGADITSAAAEGGDKAAAGADATTALAEGEAPAGAEVTPAAGGAQKEPAEGAEEAPAPAAPATRPDRMRFTAPATAAPVPPLDAYSLRLIASHQLWDAGVVVQHSSHLAGLGSPPRVRANPADLERLGHASGSRIKIVSPRGSLVLPVDADAAIPRGSAALGFNLTGESAGDLIDATAAVTNVRLDSV
jgi:anaerobic selenocysteine-containing dehydrogenase